MKRIIAVLLTLVFLLCACSADTTVGELIDPNYHQNNTATTIVEQTPDERYYEDGVPEYLCFLMDNIDDFDKAGITLDDLELYLNSLDYQVMDSNAFRWIRVRYEELCEGEERLPQVAYPPFAIADFPNEEIFFGPAVNSNINNIFVNDKIYTPDWVYRHTIAEYEAAGITPDMIERKLYYYAGFPYNRVSVEFFENKLNAYLGRDDVMLDISPMRDLSGEGYDVIFEMPEPFDNSDASSAREYWYYPVGNEFIVPNYLINLVSEEDFDEWLNSFEADALSEYDLPDIFSFPNVYSFVVHFDIPTEAVYEAYNGPFYTSSDEMSEYYWHLAQRIVDRSEYGLVHNFLSGYSTIVTDTHFFTPDWVYNHSVSEWEAAGITPEKVLEKVNFYDDYSLTDEARVAFEYKLGYFLGYDISIDRKRNFSSMVINGKEYDIYWFACHTIQDYEKEGITLENVEHFLEYAGEYWKGTPEYEWIESAYLRMLEDESGR